ncbi:MAG TPA: MBL fold metallo-hydrolase [Selenomonadales bacterium]|nr:MBL fold metallo-hydrolase [Selenomonadales bacterium]
MELRLIRHATLVLTLGGVRLLVDPMLSPAGAMAPIDNSANPRRNPLVDLPVAESQLYSVDAVLLTHTHRDHFDAAAAERLPKDLPVFCQSEDEEKLRGLGFKQVTAVADTAMFQGLALTRTGGRHGTGAIGAQMAPVSGYVLRRQGEPVLYLAGDTVWCPEVEAALAVHRPEVVVLFAGAAQFLTGDPITMTADDVARVCRKAPQARVVAVHMEVFNHCFLTRGLLHDAMTGQGLAGRVHIPADGELLRF